MGQAEVIAVLERAKKPLSRTEIAKILNEKPHNISVNIRKLLDHKEINYKEIDRAAAFVLYNAKRRLKLYYV